MYCNEPKLRLLKYCILDSLTSCLICKSNVASHCLEAVTLHVRVCVHVCVCVCVHVCVCVCACVCVCVCVCELGYVYKGVAAMWESLTIKYQSSITWMKYHS